ncbi:hypothetical protein HGRIS_009076 [Hohenbuehelia grisea]|uniref:Conidiation-specific protein 6 n=1 Tax=Hohenbuehelia grisea TaxID=104357 RepID=A0ABR3J014_9AGAR
MSGNVGKNPKQVAGGFKATIHNSNARNEAKQHAAEKLHEMDVDVLTNDDEYILDKFEIGDDEDDDEDDDFVDEDDDEGQIMNSAPMGLNASGHSHGKTVHTSKTKNRTNVLGGYKATLKNPNAGEKAKHHAEEILKAEGEM